MRKLKLLILTIIGLIGIVSLSPIVKAQEYEGKIKATDYIPGPYYYMHAQGSHILWEQSQFIVRTTDGQRVYCVQPFAKIKDDATYEVTAEDIEGVLNISKEQWQEISKIAYYGWGYTDSTHNHNADKWYAATQMLIWQKVAPDIESYFTKTLKGTRDDSILRNEMNEIMDLVNKHTIKPSFNNFPSQMIMGNSITLVDSNGVLGNYDIANINGANIVKNGNNITITPNKVGNISFSLQKLGNRYGEPIELYYAITAQDVIHKGNIDPININYNINVLGGKVAINKVDSKTLNNKAQGQASLEGAVYGVYKEDGTLLTKITTDSNGYAKSDYLPVMGRVYLQEIKASKGYKLDNNKYYVELTNDNLEPTIQVKEDVIEGTIKVFKQDSETKACKAQGGATLVGAKYGVYDPSGTLVDTLIIGNDCSATSKKLPYSKYTVKEIESSEGYYLDNTTYSVDINEEKELNVTSKEQVIKGKIKITKQDSETKSCKAQGQATLVGAEYGIYDKEGKLLDTLIIGNDCTATSKELPYYPNYKVKEIKSSVGYQLDKNIYTVNINSSQTINVTSKEDVIKNYISILKQYDYVDGTTQFLNAEKGISFEIYYPDGKLYDTITTDKNGYATIEIPYGVWKFHQVNSTTGFEKIYDFYITVDENSNKEQYYNILNNSISAYFQVFKIDSETNKVVALANTTFKIYNIDKKQYVSQYVGGKVYSEFKTDDEGKFITYLKLESGNYRLIETGSPKGYLINEEGCLFTIGDNTYFNYTTYGAFITVSYKNTPIKGQIEINKKGEYPKVENGKIDYIKIDLKDVEFNIYAKEDIKSSDGNYLYYNKGDLVDTIKTDSNGYAISKKLPLGKYIVVEIKTNDKYILDSKEYDVELNEIDNKTEIVYETLNILNKYYKGELEFTKTDLTSGKVIPNTKIEIYTEDDELVYEGITDENGKVTIKELFVGRFYIIEKEAATGYRLSEEKVYFEIKDNGEIVKATMTNEKKKGTLEFTKTDFSTSEPLPNTKIEIYTENDELVYEGITDENGMIIISELEYGRYYILEKEAPEGYILNTEKMYFEILEDGEVVKATMTNEKVEIEIPNTESNEYIIPICTILIGIATGIVIYEKIKKRK